jgi:hypothetical protein
MGNYNAEADAIKRKWRNEPIKVLVWGPGNPGIGAPPDKIKAYQKRKKIKEELKVKFPCAEVYFSEDKEMIKISEGIHGQIRREALQAKLSDLVLMLDISRGVDLELDHFIPTYPWFRDKVYIFLPEEYVSTTGLVADVLEKVPRCQIEGFTKDEFDSCKVASEKAVRIVDNVALEKILNE